MKNKVGRLGKSFTFARIIDRQHAHYGDLVYFVRKIWHCLSIQ